MRMVDDAVKGLVSTTANDKAVAENLYLSSRDHEAILDGKGKETKPMATRLGYV
jgi:hypothetical protein